MPRASGSEASWRWRSSLEATTSAANGGRRSSRPTRPAAFGAESQSSSGVAVPGASASRAVARRLSSTTTKPWPSSSEAGKRLATPTIRTGSWLSWKLSVIVEPTGSEPGDVRADERRQGDAVGRLRPPDDDGLALRERVGQPRRLAGAELRPVRGRASRPSRSRSSARRSRPSPSAGRAPSIRTG